MAADETALTAIGDIFEDRIKLRSRILKPVAGIPSLPRNDFHRI